jgi:hypothetical protein
MSASIDSSKTHGDHARARVIAGVAVGVVAGAFLGDHIAQRNGSHCHSESCEGPGFDGLALIIEYGVAGGILGGLLGRYWPW